MRMHEPKRLCSVVVYADPLAARRGQVGRTLQLYSGGGVEGATTPPSVNNTLALHRRQVETLAWKAAPQLEPRVSFQLLGGKESSGCGCPRWGIYPTALDRQRYKTIWS